MILKRGREVQKICRRNSLKQCWEVHEEIVLWILIGIAEGFYKSISGRLFRRIPERFLKKNAKEISNDLKISRKNPKGFQIKYLRISHSRC